MHYVFGVLAFKLPLPLFILPSIGASLAYIGMWSPVLATALIAAGIILGLLVYALTTTRGYRTVGSFVGGEDPEKLEEEFGDAFDGMDLPDEAEPGGQDSAAKVRTNRPRRDPKLHEMADFL